MPPYLGDTPTEIVCTGPQERRKSSLATRAPGASGVARRLLVWPVMTRNFVKEVVANTTLFLCSTAVLAFLVIAR